VSNKTILKEKIEKVSSRPLRLDQIYGMNRVCIKKKNSRINSVCAGFSTVEFFSGTIVLFYRLLRQ